MGWFRALTMAGMLMGPVVAQAATGLQWQWPEETKRRYRVKSDISLHGAIMMEAEYNRSARVYDLAIAMDVDCTPSRVGKTFELLCAIDKVQMQAGGEDDGNLLEILQEWASKLEEAEVLLLLSADGKVKQVDLRGMNERNQRIRRIKETLHAFVTRMFSTFDLQLPKGGDDEGEAWKQRSELVLQLPLLTGGAGSSQLSSSATEEEGSNVVIDTTGRASLMIGQQITGPGDTRPPDVFDLTLSSRSVFDTEQGLLTSRAMQVRGDLTPSSGSAMGRAPAPYLFAAELQYVPPGTAMPNLGPTKVRPMK